MKNLKEKEFHEIEITCKTDSPYYSIRFWTSMLSNHLTCSSTNESMTLKGVFSEAEKFLLSKRLKFQWTRYIYLLCVFVGLAPTFLYYGYVGKSILNSIIGLSLIFLTIIIYVFYQATASFREMKIYLGNKTEQDTFWKRNKDKIVLMIISSTITFILGILSVLLVQWISK